MQRVPIALMIVCLWGDTPAVADAFTKADEVQLSVSKSNPYVGEQIEFKLLIRTATSKTPLALTIPWITTGEAWQLQFDQWLNGFHKKESPLLALRFFDGMIFATQVKPGEYQLTWKMVVQSPGDEEGWSRTLPAIQVGTLRSNSVTLNIQPTAVRSPTSTLWDLGTGTFRVTTRWAEASVVLGEEATLILTVEGDGPLERVSPPPLHTLPGWEGDRFLLEAMPAQWKHSQRLFLYRVRPRQLRAALPPIMIRYFDPQRGSTITQQVNLPLLKVLAARQSSASLTGSTVADAFKHLPGFRRDALEQHPTNSWTKGTWWMAVIPAAWGIILLTKQALQSLAPTWLEQRRWRRADRLTRHALDHGAVSPVELRHILADYVSVGMDETTSADWETLNMMASLTPRKQLLGPLLEEMQWSEYGPTPAESFAQVRQSVKAVFQQSQELT